jgi:hypothetical protein
MKRDVGIGYTIMRKIHYNVMRFRETMGVDEAEVLAGRYKSDFLPEYALKKKVRWNMNSKQGSRYIKRRMGNDLKQKILVQNGIISEQQIEKKPSVLNCPRCSLVNAIENKYCSKCSYPLVPSAFDEIKAAEDIKFRAIEERFNNMQSMFEKLITSLSKTTDQQQLNNVTQSSFSSGILKPVVGEEEVANRHLSLFCVLSCHSMQSNSSSVMNQDKILFLKDHSDTNDDYLTEGDTTFFRWALTFSYAFCNLASVVDIFQNYNGQYNNDYIYHRATYIMYTHTYINTNKCLMCLFEGDDLSFGFKIYFD